MKCPSHFENTPQLWSPSEPTQQGLYAKVPSRNWTRCPIEVGVGAEVRNGLDPRHKGLNSKIRLAGAPSTKVPIDANSIIKFMTIPTKPTKPMKPEIHGVKMGTR